MHAERPSCGRRGDCGLPAGKSEGSRGLQAARERRGTPRCIQRRGGWRGRRRCAVPLRPQRSLSQRRGVPCGRCVMGKSPAEPHTFSRFLNFRVGGAGRERRWRGGEGVRACSGCLLAEFPPAPSGRPLGPSGERAAGGQVAPGRRARALALPPGAERAAVPSWCEGGDVFPPTHF